MVISDQNGPVTQVLITFVQPLVIEKSALSGIFDRHQSENLLHLARKIRMFNIKVNHMIAVIQARAENGFLIHAAENVEQTRAGSIEALRHVARQLGISIDENYPDWI